MREITLESPLHILIDAYHKEGAQLYDIIRKLLSYPLPIEKDDDEDGNLEGKLYSIGFSFIMWDYLRESLGSIYAPDCDEDQLQESVRMKVHENEIDEMLLTLKDEEKQDLEGNEQLGNKVFLLGQHYKMKILKDLGKVFTNEFYLMGFFATIFPDDAGGMDMLDAADVYNYFKKAFRS